MSGAPSSTLAQRFDAALAIEVRTQHRMPIARSFALCWKGVGHRLLRSLMTLAVILLAVAFFMTLLAEAAYSDAVARGLAGERYQRDLATRRLATWFARPDDDAVRARLASARHHPDELRELARLAALSEQQARDLAARVHDEARVVGYFVDLDAGTRAVLVPGARPRDVLAYLQSEPRLSALTRTLAELPSLRLPPLRRDLATIVHDHVALARDLAALGRALGTRGDEVAEKLRHQLAIEGPAGAVQALVRGDPGDMAVLAAALHDAGFADTAESLAEVQRQLRLRALEQQLRSELANDEQRVAWLRAFQSDPPVEDKLRALADPRVAAMFATRYSRDQLAAVGHALTKEARLVELTDTLRERSGGPTDEGGALNGRRRLLLAVSFVVCLVGIANAMFMAITERFREIATMKCLGATDGFILQQFLMEAFLHGLAGGVLGGAIGGLLATVQCGVLYGAALATYFPMGALLTAAALALATGIALAMLASMVPAWAASRMAPMQAMRVE